MQVELDEQGYTLDKKWKLVPVYITEEMKTAFKSFSYNGNMINLGYIVMIDSSPKLVFEGPDFKTERQPRIGDIHIGGEITEEFEKAGKEMWCKHCGSGISFENHLPSCPTLVNKI